MRIRKQRRHLQPLVLGGEVRTEVVALASVVGTHVVALLVEVARRDHVGRVVAAAREADVVILLQRRLEDLIHVIGAVPVLLQVADLLGRELGSQPRIGLGDIEQRGVLPTLDRRIEHLGILHAHHRRKLHDRSLVLLALLGRDEQYAVGGARSVDGGRTGILQHRNRLDIRGVELVEAGVVGNQSVDDDQRFVVVHRTDTADVDVELVVGGVIAALLDHKARGGTLQGLREVGHRAFGDRLRLDLIHGAHGPAAGRRTVTDHDHLVDQLRILLERDVDHRTVGHRQFLRGVTDERETEFRIRGAGKFILTVQVGRSARGGALDENGNAGQRIALSIFHDAPDGQLGGLFQSIKMFGLGRVSQHRGGENQPQNRYNDLILKFSHK